MGVAIATLVGCIGGHARYVEVVRGWLESPLVCGTVGPCIRIATDERAGCEGSGDRRGDHQTPAHRITGFTVRAPAARAWLLVDSSDSFRVAPVPHKWDDPPARYV